MEELKLLQNKYKEVDPMETVQKIRGILTDMGLGYSENVENSGVGTYWAKLCIYYDKKFISNSGGKGNTREFALASAYGEMIEGLQTDMVRVNRQYYGFHNKEEMGYEEFVVYPDEKREEDKHKHINEYRMFKYLRENSVNKPYAHIMGKFIEKYVDSLHNSYGYIPLIEYENYITGEMTQVDETFIRYINGSTGLSSGNTLHESLIQGLCEIIERHVKHEVYHKNLCLPIIPFDYLTDYAKFICRNINNTGRYNIEVRDASLGVGMPVVSVVLYDKLSRGYVVSFGAFPVKDIAIDRTINELVQFHHIDDIESMTAFRSYDPSNYIHEGKKFLGVLEFDPKTRHDGYNILSTNRYNMGQYKDRFFGDEFDYEFKPWEISQLKSNEELLDDLCELVNREFNTDIIYKEFSFLGFISTSVVCPQLLGRQFIELDLVYSALLLDRGCVEEFIYGGMKDTEKFIREYTSMYSDTNMNILLGRPTKFEVEGTQLMDGYVEFIKGNYEEASRIMMQNQFILGPIGARASDRIHDIYNCIYSYIGMMDSIQDKEQIRLILGKFYKLDIVDMAEDACRDYKTLAYALFIDPESELCLVDWDSYEASKKLFRVVLDRKRKHFEN